MNLTARAYYVVSYHAPVGRYAKAATLITSAGLTRGLLYAPRSGEAGANGVYRYGAGGGFPSSTSRATNYWGDVVFTTG